MANKQCNLAKLYEQRKEWKTVNVECLTDTDKQRYLSRKLAVDMYINGKALKEIEVVTNIKPTKYLALVKKCLQLDEHGLMLGYTALIPYKHLKKYERKQEVKDNSLNYAGALSQLFDKYPSLKERTDDLFLQRDKTILEKNMKPIIIYDKFLNQCKELGIKENEYPFNTSNLGKRSFYEYLKDLEKRMANEAIYRYHKNSIQKFNSTGIGMVTNYERLRPYSKVQIDGHKVDLEATIRIEDENGDVCYVPIKRFWLLTLIDVATRTILGYHLTIKDEYDRFDILLCIKNAIEPRKRMTFTIPRFQYPEGGGYPSFEINETKWAVFDEIELDNALSHHSQLAVSKITEYLNAAMSFGPVSTPERRGIIERFFGVLEEKGYHRVVSTTGSNINDARRKQSEEDAVKFQITFQEIVELTEVLIANYNLTSNSMLKGFSPLEIMKQRIERGLQPSLLEDDKQIDFALLQYSETRQVRGSIKTGRRPYIQFEEAEYRSDELSYDYNLIGKKITVLINPEDLRTLIAYKEDGTEIGKLYVVGKWSNTPHTLKQRKEITRFFRMNHIALGPFDDPVSIYHDYLQYKAKDNKSARNKLGHLQNTIGNSKNFDTKNNVLRLNQHLETDNEVSNNTLLSKEELLASFNSNEILALYTKEG